MLSHLGNSWRLKNTGDFKVEQQRLMYVSENCRGQKRVSAERKEVIMDTDPFDLQDGRPNIGQGFLERRLRRTEDLWQDAAIFQSKLRRQTDALHFAGRAFRQLRKDDNLARDLEVG